MNMNKKESDYIKYYNETLDKECTLTKAEYWTHLFGNTTPLEFVRNCGGIPIGVSKDYQYNHDEDPLKNMIWRFVIEFTDYAGFGGHDFLIDEDKIIKYRGTLSAWIEETLLNDPQVKTLYSQLKN